MSVHDFADCLFEVGCEELPSATLQPLSHALMQSLQTRLQEAELAFSHMDSFATPRRLAVIIYNLKSKQPDRVVDHFGPPLNQAYDAAGNLTAASIGFARSCGVSPDQLQIKETAKGQRMACTIIQSGVETAQLLPEFFAQALNNLPIAKPMRWASNSFSFVRPVHWLLLLYGKQHLPLTVLGQQAAPYTFGHRFLFPNKLLLSSAQEYVLTLEQQGFVISHFVKRRQRIHQLINECLQPGEQAVVPDDLLDEVTGLVEWPVALLGHFKEEFLQIPQEVLITSMQTHQKCFAVVDAKQNLLAKFVVVSNIVSKDPATVIRGNERVINARLADAAFFYTKDCKQRITDMTAKLQHVVFQQQLGSLAEKSQRITRLTELIAEQIDANVTLAKQAATLAKCDLLTAMVGEFPNLQGIMGYYYALHAGIDPVCALAIQQHYWPRFAGDQLPESLEACAVALADRIDTLIGILGINQAPSGDKDPFALRRAALGICRLLIEKSLPVDLWQLFQQGREAYLANNILPNTEVVAEAFQLVLQRLKSWYLDQKVSVDIFAAVAACHPTSLLNFDQRLRAVQQFKQLPEAIALAAANKRVSNILKKLQETLPSQVEPQLLSLPAEQQLYALVEQLSVQISILCQENHYEQALLLLATLKPAVDDFFEQVMVMVEDSNVRCNRLALLYSLRQLFTQIADIALLQA